MVTRSPRNPVQIALSAVGIFILMLLAFAGSAIATGNPTTPTSSVEFTNTTATSDNTASFTDASVAFSTGIGKEQIGFTMPLGLPKAQRQHATRCLKAASDTRPARKGEKCGHIKIGTPITNSGVLRSTGHPGMFADVVHPGDTFYLVNGQWRKGKCGNKVWFKFSQPHPKGRVLPASKVEVVQFFTWRATVAVKGSVKGTSSSLARCFINGQLGAEATSSASGEASASASATASGSSKQLAMITARGNAQQVFNGTQLGSVRTAAEQNASLNLRSTATVWCNRLKATNSFPPETTPPSTPPTLTPPSILSVTTINDVDVGGISPNFCATASMPGNETGTMIFSPTWGSFGPSGIAKFSNVSGIDRECATYVAPTEVPAGGNEIITVTLRSNTTGLSASPANTQSFPLNPPPWRP